MRLPWLKAGFSLELLIEDLAHDGRGIARAGQKAVFVDGALPGERVRARLVKRHRQYDDAAAEEILELSRDRVEPRCAHVAVCSGCSLQHLDPQRQIEFKQKQLLDSLARIGKVQPQRVLPALQREIWGYRRKARLSVRFVEKKGRALVGFREANGRYVAEIELRLHCIQRERTTLYAERQAHRINDESLRSLVSELDLQEVSMGKRLRAARRAAGMAAQD